MAGLYIHIPFCSRKCPYCDFVSWPADLSTKEDYIEGLLSEMELVAGSGDLSSISFDTLYIGGGTPSCLPASHIERIMARLLHVFTWGRHDFEATIEVNPESVTMEKLCRYLDAGLNRLSIGIQDLTSSGLEAIGRSHDTAKALDAFHIARDVGFRNVSIDIMYAIPGQGLKDLQKTLEGVVDLGPDHVSCYELTPEPGTAFKEAVEKGNIRMPDEDLVLEMTDLAESFLEGHGYRQCEISNFARPGMQCLHNLNYWENGPYLGMGCAAVSFIGGRRYGNTANLERYLACLEKGMLPLEWQEMLGKEERFRESVILGLRTISGIDIDMFRKRWGFDPVRYYARILPDLMDKGLIDVSAENIFLTRKGRRLANLVLSALV